MHKFFHFKHNKWQIPVAIALLAFGFLLTAQYRTQVGVSTSLEGQSINDLSALVINLSENRTTLQNELSNLRTEIQAMQDKTDSGISLTTTLTNQIEQLNIITGAAAVSGPGVSVTITGDSQIMYLDLIDLINELYGTGAEIVSVNDTRVTMHTAFSESANLDGTYALMMDGKKLLSPIIIKAIGNPDTLEKGLTFTGGIINNLNVFYHIYPTVKKEELLEIPTETSNNQVTIPVTTTALEAVNE